MSLLNKCILIVVPTYASYRVFLRMLACRMAEAGWTVHVATNLDCAKNHNEQIELHNIAFPRGAKPILLLRAGLQLRKLIKNTQPSIVHAHFSIAILCLALFCSGKARNYGTFQGLRFTLARGITRRMFKVLECWSIRRMDTCWVLTEDDFQAALPFSEGKLSMQQGFGFGCDMARFDRTRYSGEDCDQLRARLGIDSDAFVFVYLGRLTAFKGFDLLLQSFTRLHSVSPKARLLVIGEEDETHPLSLPELGQLGGVCHVGWQGDPAPYLAIADMMVFPSCREGMPVCLMEAISMEVPILTSKSRGCRELAELAGGQTVERDEEQLLAAMQQAIAKPPERPKPAPRLDRELFINYYLRKYESDVRT